MVLKVGINLMLPWLPHLSLTCMFELALPMILTSVQSKMWQAAITFTKSRLGWLSLCWTVPVQSEHKQAESRGEEKRNCELAAHLPLKTGRFDHRQACGVWCVCFLSAHWRFSSLIIPRTSLHCPRNHSSYKATTRSCIWLKLVKTCMARGDRDKDGLRFVQRSPEPTHARWFGFGT